MVGEHSYLISVFAKKQRRSAEFPSKNPLTAPFFCVRFVVHTSSVCLFFCLAGRDVANESEDSDDSDSDNADGNDNDHNNDDGAGAGAGAGDGDGDGDGGDNDDGDDGDDDADSDADAASFPCERIQFVQRLRCLEAFNFSPLKPWQTRLQVSRFLKP